MNNDERIARLETQIDQLQAKQAELWKQLAQAERDQWQGRIDELELQMHLGAMEGNDKAHALMDQLRTRWSEVRRQYDDASSTAIDVGSTLRNGIESAVRDVRQALMESKNKIRS